MTYRQREIVRMGFERLRPEFDRFVSTFYRRLFKLHPEYRALFPEVMARQRVKLAVALQQMADLVDHPEAIASACRSLGRFHGAKGVSASDYPKMEEAFLDALSSVLGDSWNPEAREAWMTLYGRISEAMIEGSQNQAA
jgi:hemoglobin-like flavoprotein